MNFNNYIALITGAASGIGEATARLFVKNGAKVIIADIDEKRGAVLVSELGGNAIFYKVDVSNSTQVEKMFQMVEKNIWSTRCFT
mgnify:CR=1 FL=1